jgi:hypothetical protein
MESVPHMIEMGIGFFKATGIFKAFIKWTIFKFPQQGQMYKVIVFLKI